jgi:phage/plasmid-associated DNA primase
VVVVAFERTFAAGAPGTIPRDQLDAMLADPEELSGVLNKALEAITAIRSRGLTETDSMRRAMNEFRQATDPLAVWLDGYTVLCPNAVTPKDHLYREYCRNCSNAGRPTISKTAFGRGIKKLRPTVADYQRTVSGVLTWCYIGLGLVTTERE